MKLLYLYSAVSLLVGLALSTPVPPDDLWLKRTNARVGKFIEKVTKGEIKTGDATSILNFWTGKFSAEQVSTIDIVDVIEGQPHTYKGISRTIDRDGRHIQYQLWLQEGDFAWPVTGEGPDPIYGNRVPGEGQFLHEDGTFKITAINAALRIHDEHFLQLTQSGLTKITTYTEAIQNHAKEKGIDLTRPNTLMYAINMHPATLQPAQPAKRGTVLQQLSNAGSSSSSSKSSLSASVQTILMQYAKLQTNVTATLIPFIEKILDSNNTLLHALALPLYGMTSPTTLFTSSSFAPGLMARQFDSFSGKQAQMKAAGNYSSAQLQETNSTVEWLRAEFDSRWDEAEKVVNATGELLAMRNIQVYLGSLELSSNGTGIFPESYYQVQKDDTLDGLLRRLNVSEMV